MNIVQSYVSAIMRARLSLHEMRVVLIIAERANTLLKGHRAEEFIERAVCSDGINCNFAMAIREVMSDGSHHYDEVKQSILSLASKTIEGYDTASGQWRKTAIIYNVSGSDQAGTIRFSCAKWFIDFLLDFSRGFSRYNLESAMRLRTPSAVRLYILTSSITNKMRFSVDFFKSMLAVDGLNPKTGKAYYAQTRDFIKRAIDPAIKELDDQGLNSFRYEVVRRGNKIVALDCYPVKREQISKAEITARAGLSAWINPALKALLLSSCGFSARELSANKSTLFDFGRLPDWQDRILLIIERQRKKRASKGYIIAAIKSAIREGSAKQ